MTGRALPKQPHSVWRLGLFGLVPVLFLGLIQTGPLINPGGMPQAWQFLQASLHPDLSVSFVLLIARATAVTFAYAVCGTLLSLGVGFIGGLLSSEVWWRTLWPRGNRLWLVARGLLSLPRAIHELIWGLILVNVLGLDPLVAILAITIPFGAIVAKVFSEILDETPQAPLKAMVGAGVSPLQAVLYGLLPQALPNLLSYGFYRFECALRSSAVLGIIGAGGLGYEIFLSLQSLQYEQLWTAFYVLILLNGCVDAWSAMVRHRLGFVSRLALNRSGGEKEADDRRQMPGDRRPERHHRQRTDWLVWGGIGLVSVLCFEYVGADWSLLWSGRTFRLLQDLLVSAVPQVPTLSQGLTLLSLAWQTVVMSLLAIGLASVGGLILSFPAARGGWCRWPDPSSLGSSQPTLIRRLLTQASYSGARIILLVSRAIPAPIWALVFLFVMFPGVWPGALALALHNFGILGRLMAEVNENADQRSVRALLAQGASSLQALLYGGVPQVLPQFLAYSLYRWEVCLRATVIVGLVGAGGLGRLITEQISSFDHGGLTLTLMMFIGLTMLIDTVSTALRQRLR